MRKPKVPLEWLLESEQPAVRYLALTQLLDRPEDDGEVRSAKEAIATSGWAADLLAGQDRGGRWVGEENLYLPKYTATNWKLLVLSDLGLTKSEPRIGKACELWIARFAREDGGFDTEGADKSELCLVGNTARALVRFGYADHPKVRSAMDWLVRNQKANGGWHCYGRNGVIDAWEGMSAFAVYPKRKWTAGMTRAVERGAEFYLARRLHKQGARYGPWYRFHYPVHYYYDVLVGLDFMTALGYGDDPRLADARTILEEKRRPDGRWNLDAVHPDVEGPSAKWYRRTPPTPLALEKPGEPSKLITLRAMTVLRRLDEAR